MVGAGVSICVTGIYRFPSLDVVAFLTGLDLFMSTWQDMAHIPTTSFQVTIPKSGSSSLQFHQSTLNCVTATSKRLRIAYSLTSMLEQL